MSLIKLSSIHLTAKHQASILKKFGKKALDYAHWLQSQDTRLSGPTILSKVKEQFKPIKIKVPTLPSKVSSPSQPELFDTTDQIVLKNRTSWPRRKK